MSFPAALWDLQELKTVGSILLLCFSFKLLHVLGIIDLTGGDGTKTVMGLQWGGCSGCSGVGMRWSRVTMVCGCSVKVGLCLLCQGSECSMQELQGALRVLRRMCFGACGGHMGVLGHQDVRSWGSEGFGCWGVSYWGLLQY